MNDYHPPHEQVVSSNTKPKPTTSMAHPQQPPSFDDLYCSEETPFDQPYHAPPSLLLQQDMAWEDQQLISLLSKQSLNLTIHTLRSDPALQATREEAVDWILKSRALYGFSPLTAVLAVDYFDRFLANFRLQREEPWTAQLTAVACLSIAAKVEETYVPSLLDLQEGKSEFYFQAKDVEKMEVVVLSALRWKMNPVTIVSFLDYFARRLEMENHLRWELYRKCETIVLSIIPDLRYTSYTPSVMATAITLHVLHTLRPLQVQHYQSQLLSILKIQKDNVEGCRKLVMDCTSGVSPHGYGSSKRELVLGSESMPGSPIGVLDICFSPESEGLWFASDESDSKRRRTR